MESKFNFYDFVGIVIPGGLGLLLAYWFCIGFLGLIWPVDLSSIGGSVLLVAGSYLLGQLVQAGGNAIEHRYRERWGGYFSEQFMRDDNTHFTPEFKAEVEKYVEEKFGLSYAPADTDARIQGKKRQEIFQLCYEFIVQEGVAKQAEVFNGIYSLYRGTVTAACFGVFISLLVIVKQLLMAGIALSGIVIPWLGLPEDRFWRYDELQLYLSIIAMLSFILSIRPLEARFRRFGEYFAASVYKSFYILCRRNDPKGKSSP